MCGRMCCVARGPAHLAAVYGVPPHRMSGAQRFRPSANFHPGMACPVVVGGAASSKFQAEGAVTEEKGHGSAGGAADGAIKCHDDRALVVMQWGLVPSYTKKDERPDHFRMFNARCETVCEKTTFKRLVNRKRCLIAVDGFYEWQKLPKGEKQPYFVKFSDGRPITFAGLWDTWHHPTEEDPENVSHTFTFMTTNPSKQLSWLHDRMPVIFKSREQEEKWLDVDKYKAEDLMKELSQPYDRDDLVWHPVDRRVGSMKYQGDDCNKPVQLPGEKKASTLKSFFKKGSPSTCVTSTTHPQEADHKPAAKEELPSPSGHDMDEKEDIKLAHLKNEDASPQKQSNKRPLEHETEAKPDLESFVSPSSPARASKPSSSGGGGSASKKSRTGGSTPASAAKGQKTMQSYFKKA